MGFLTTFIVPGVPVPQGSLRSFERGGGTYTVSANAGRLERWRGDIRTAAKPGFTVPESPIPDVAFVCAATFLYARPKSHLTSKGLVKKGYEHRRPRGDTDKLLRAVLDALTHVVWTDDEQVDTVAASRRWAEPGEALGAHITIATED